MPKFPDETSPNLEDRREANKTSWPTSSYYGHDLEENKEPKEGGTAHRHLGDNQDLSHQSGMLERPGESWTQSDHATDFRSRTAHEHRDYWDAGRPILTSIRRGGEKIDSRTWSPDAEPGPTAKTQSVGNVYLDGMIVGKVHRVRRR